ncbi:hypothetical protein CERSUDRAFT_75778 [Gelatoporia subvermispora B]|uniref:F-box domain-containing protein n=1 Tax=Ceriporiopsis subvermispora (strain B) TaxID=914234 RepID=M2QCX9_CERS8|nr:hypothetical protein CERSUDRAFT_75778 [Gelatoporia subvermispora B]
MKLLIEILSHAQQLEELRMTLNVLTLKEYPQLLSFIESLDNFKALILVFHGAPLALSQSITRMRPLRKLHIVHINKSVFDPASLSDAQYRSLEELRFSVSFRTLRHCREFPRVRHLHLKTNSTELSIRVLACMFPNVTNLHLDELDGRDLFHPSAARAKNQQLQTARTWMQQLEAVSGCLWPLFVAGLMCKLKYLEIDVYPYETERVRTVLSDARPSQLHLEISCWMLEEMGGLCGAILQFVETDNLFSLDSQYNGRGDVDPQALVRHKRSVCSMKAAHFRYFYLGEDSSSVFTFASEDPRDPARGTRPTWQRPRYILGRILCKLDTRALAMQFAVAARKLQRLVLGEHMCPKSQCSNITRDDEGHVSMTQVLRPSQYRHKVDRVRYSKI